MLQLRGVSKLFGRLRAVDQVSLDVPRGEIITLLGPSGCGKTTTLRMVIGLERCDEGEIVYQGRVVDSPRRGVYFPTHKRNMGIVFQSYAIWPHMTVFENVAYPLRVRRVKERETRQAVERALAMVGLAGLADRPAPNLSGGQQQRVALARSLVFEPQLLLLDEPFSNLDARLRAQMRAEVRVLQRQLGITVLFVTHDQVEALGLSDWIAVMNAGRIEQVGRPQDLYWHPQTPAVRDFLGQTVLLRGRVAARRGDGTLEVAVQGAEHVLACAAAGAAELALGGECYLAIRPEEVDVRPGRAEAGAANTLGGTLEALLFIGNCYEAQIALAGGDRVLVNLPTTSHWREGQPVTLRLPAAAIQPWPAERPAEAGEATC
jgi:ABC-type Fe3+/spermidine/putrescine transport system ATPase subunit